MRRIIIASLLIMSLFSGQVMALTSDQKELFDQGIYYFNTQAFASCTDDSSNTSVSPVLPANVPEPYNSLLTQAATAYKANVQLLAAIFLSENGNTWKPFDTAWASSPVGASGPWQFMPGTWSAYKVDGNSDGRIDINNMYDATFSAAHLLSGYATANAPLGSLNTPFKANTLTEAAAAYNWGPGNVQQAGQGAPLSRAPTETENYVKNVYSLIKSGFTKSGNPNYGDPKSDVNGTQSASGSSVFDCSGVVSGSIVETAIALSWPTPSNEASPPRDPHVATATYRNAVIKYNPGAPFSGEDCGAFVATVMRASGADADYPLSGTSAQQAYVESHPEKYTVVANAQSTADLQPGDILIVNAGGGAGTSGHTLIYIGPHGKYNEASASLQDRMPNLGNASGNFGAGLMDTIGRGHYVVARLK